MEKIAEKITKILLKNKYIEKSMYEIYEYGLMMFLEIILSFSTSVLICCAMGMIWEGIIFFLFFIPIRSYLGGLHMKSYLSCFFYSVMAIIIILLMVKYISVKVLISIIIVTICEVVILIVAYKEKRKCEEGKEFFLKVVSIIIITESISFVLFFSNNGKMLFLVACTYLLVTLSKLCEKLYVTSTVGRTGRE